MGDPASNTTSTSQMMSAAPAGVDPAYVYAMFTVRVLVTATGMLGNTLVIVVICTSRALRSSESHSYLYMVSLALADLGVSSFIMSFGLHLTLNSGAWSLGHVACNFFNSLDVHLTTVSLLQLSLMTLDRYLAVCHPYRHAAIQRKYAVAMVAACWTLPVFSSFLPVMNGWHEPYHSASTPTTGFCGFDVNPVFIFMAGGLSFLIPTVIILTLNAKLCLVARRQARAVHAQETAVGPSGQSGAPPGVHRRGHRSSLHSKATRTVGLLTGCFLLCWWPFVFVTLSHSFCGCVPHIAIDVAVWFGYTNSALNPFLYLASNVPVRRAAARRLTCRSCKNSVSPSVSVTQGMSTTGGLS